MGNKQAVGPKLDFSHPLLGNTVEYQSNVGTIVKYNDPNEKQDEQEEYVSSLSLSLLWSNFAMNQSTSTNFN